MEMRRIYLSKEFYLAAFTLMLGVWCVDQTRGLEGDAWLFPFYLSLALCFLGGALLVQCLLDKSERKFDRESLHAMLWGAAPFAVIAGFWAWSLEFGLGYLLPSVAASFAMLTVLQYAKLPSRLLRAVMITMIIFALFYIIFDSPLPVLEAVDDFFNSIDQMLR